MWQGSTRLSPASHSMIHIVVEAGSLQVNCGPNIQPGFDHIEIDSILRSNED